MMKTHNLNSAKEVLQHNETAAFLTSGTSMYPLLRTHKDIVVISRAVHPLSVGEVPLYSKKGVTKLVLHRIIGISPDGKYIIRGDNTYTKEYIPKEDIVGVMTAIYRSGKYIDCKNSKWYKIYVKTVIAFYPLRWLWKTKIKVILSKIKRKILAL